MTASTSEPHYDTVWPGSASGIQPQRKAPRLATLDGARVAFLWDYLFRGDELFPVLSRGLSQRFADLEVIGYEEFGNLHGPDEKERLAALGSELQARHVDAVVSGMGC